ncbi:uncharacterized protein JCM6883_006547 [Sporobolomyces salmoneus]|uniref:uncharacterized protein n=1 Tax=Sporobolomyces salmoneus TaxID=183962 RepID=UPI00317D225B
MTADQGWDSQAATPTASAAVSRSPTLVDLHSHNNLDSTVEAISKVEGEELEAEEGERAEPSHHAHHLPHLNLPPHPRQHLEQYYPPENYESLDEIEREKREAQRTTGNEKGGPASEKEAQPVVPAAHDFPDGGLRAWLIVAGAWAVSFATWGYINSFGVLLSYTIQHSLSDYTESEIAWIGSFQIAAVLFTAIISGKAFDAGYVRYLLIVGLLIYTAGLFGLSYATSYAEIFLAQGVACGLASGILFLPACSAVSHYFKKNRSLALGILATGSSLGGVMFPSMLNKLIYSIGFDWAIRVAGFIVVALLIFATIVIDSRLPPRKSGRILDFGVFKDLPFTVYTFGAATVWLGLYLPIFYNEQYAVFHGVDKDIAFYSLSILNAASLFGRTIPNYFADSYGALNVVIPGCTVSGVLIFAWIGLLKSKAGTIVFCLIFGFFQGVFVSMLPASVASLTTDMSSIGIRLAMNFLAQAPFALVGTPMSGGIISIYPGQKGYTVAACVAGGFVLLGSFTIGVARSMVSKRRGTPWV